MGTTTDKLNKLIQTKAAIKSAIETKGGTVAADATFASYANSILNIPQSGGSDADTIAKILGATEANPVTINTGLDINRTNFPSLRPISELNYTQPFFNIRGLVLNANIITINQDMLWIAGGSGGGWSYGINSGLFHGWSFTTANYLSTNTNIPNYADSGDGIKYHNRLMEGTTVGTVNITEPIGSGLNSLLLGENVKVTNAINVTGNNPTGVLSYGFAHSNIPSTFDFSQWEMNYSGHALYNCTTNRNVLMINANYIQNYVFAGIDAKIIKNIYTTAVPTLNNVNAFDDDCQIYVPLSLYDSYIVATNWSAIKDQIVGMVLNTGTTYTINYKDAQGNLVQAVTSNIAQYESGRVYVEDHTLTGYLHDGITEVIYNDGGANSYDITVYPLVNRSITINYKDNNGNIIDTLTETVEVGDGGHNTIEIKETKKDSNDNYFIYNTTLTVTEDNQVFNLVGTPAKVITITRTSSDLRLGRASIATEEDLATITCASGTVDNMSMYELLHNPDTKVIKITGRKDGSYEANSVWHIEWQGGVPSGFKYAFARTNTQTPANNLSVGSTEDSATTSIIGNYGATPIAFNYNASGVPNVWTYVSGNDYISCATYRNGGGDIFIIIRTDNLSDNYIINIVKG